MLRQEWLIDLTYMSGICQVMVMLMPSDAGGGGGGSGGYYF